MGQFRGGIVGITKGNSCQNQFWPGEEPGHRVSLKQLYLPYGGCAEIHTCEYAPRHPHNHKKFYSILFVPNVLFSAAL